MRLLSTRELADALGVSESSIKRWADEGTVRASRTAGGHRRIPLSEAIRFIRELHMPLVRPEVLGLTDAASAGDVVTGDEAEQLYAFLMRGAAASVRGLIQALYLKGESVAAVVDGPIVRAMERLGELWRHEPDGIFIEHRATDICIQALDQLRASFSPPESAPLALGGAPSGDPYLLPSLAAATVLASEEYETVNLGPDTPLAALACAAEELRPALVWLSLSVNPPADHFDEQVVSLAHRMLPDGIHLVVGGRAASGLRLPRLANLHSGHSMSELAAFARGFASARRQTVWDGGEPRGGSLP